MAADPDFAKLSRQQKLAIFLIVLGPEPAAEIMRHLDDADIELVCREMSQYTMISETLRQKVLEEFSPLIGESIAATMGGLDYARRALEIARGDYKAGSIIGRLGPAGTAVEVIKDISEMEGRQIYNLVKNEQPQTISFVLSYLDGAKSAEIFALLSPDLREEVIERLGTIDSTSLDLVSKLVRNLG